MKISSTLSTYKYLPKIAIFIQKWVSLALFSILSAHNIINGHPSWFYPSSGIKKTIQNHVNLVKKREKIVYYLMRLMCIDAGICGNRHASANIGTWRPCDMAIPNQYKLIWPSGRADHFYTPWGGWMVNGHKQTFFCHKPTNIRLGPRAIWHQDNLGLYTKLCQWVPFLKEKFFFI